MLFSSVVFGGAAVSVLLSLVGAALTAGKCVCGQLTDRLGARRANRLFFSLLFLGTLLCSRPGGGFLSAAAAMLLLGVGLSLSGVGLPIFARDLALPGRYADAVRHLQIAYMTGALAFSAVPGLLADRTGSYLPAYRLLACCALLCAALVQDTYRRRAAESGHAAAEIPEAVRRCAVLPFHHPERYRAKPV